MNFRVDGDRRGDSTKEMGFQRDRETRRWGRVEEVWRCHEKIILTMWRHTEEKHGVS